MKKVYSKDGTPIAYDTQGQGPAVILVGGAMSNRQAALPFSSLLAKRFTVVAYDRRGRGDSGDKQPYAVQREIEDLKALIDEVGGPAFVYGMSSGAVLALEATRALPTKVKKLAMYEPPFMVDNTRPPVPAGYMEELKKALASGRRGDAVEMFMTKAVGVPAEAVVSMRSQPFWPGLERVAHTLVYDQTIMTDYVKCKPLPAKRWASVAVPTLVIDGGESPAWMRNGAQAITKLVPGAKYRTLPGQTHQVEPSALVPVLTEFFAS